eukprot:gene2869-3133_t
MENLLPKVSKAANSKRVKESFFSSWYVDQADPKKAIIPPYILSEFTPALEDIQRYGENKPRKKEPNYIAPEVLAQIGPSPLAVEARGVAEPTGRIILRAEQVPSLTKPSAVRPSRKLSERGGDDLVICVHCQTKSPMDFFLQRANSLRSHLLLPGHHCLRSLSGALAARSSSSSSSSKRPSTADLENKLYVLCTTSKRAAITTTVRQEIREYRFLTTSRIGLEVEVSFGRLVVCKVLENSQAAPIALRLDGAEIIAVNQERVIDLESFERAVQAAKDLPTVTILMASFKGGRGKLDDAYLFDLQKSQGMKNVLSNLFMEGGPSSRPETASTTDDDERSAGSHSTAETKDDAKEATLNNKGSTRSMMSAGARMRQKYLYDSDDEPIAEEELKNADEDPLLSDQANVNEGNKAGKEGEGTEEANFESEEEGALRAKKKSPHALQPPPSATEDNKKEGWNHLTAAETTNIIPFVVLVCMPSCLRASLRWGQPTAYIQFTNFSTSFVLEVNWIDEDGCLVQRANIPNGELHFELCSAEHVWAIVAKPMTPNKKRNSVFGIHNVGYDAEKALPMLVFRPSAPSLVSSKCVSLLWYPGVSLSATQTMYPQSKLGTGDREHVMPSLHLQLFDSPSNENKTDTKNAIMDEEALSRVQRKPLARTRTLNRQRRSRLGKSRPGFHS